jgi:hypothetical protein
VTIDPKTCHRIRREEVGDGTKNRPPPYTWPALPLARRRTSSSSDLIA